MKLKKIDKSKDELMARVRAEINLPRLAESVRLGMSVQTPYIYELVRDEMAR